MSTPLLEVRNLWRSYGDVHAVRDLSFTMQRGQITEQLEEVNARIEELQNQESSEELGDDFIGKAVCGMPLFG